MLPDRSELSSFPNAQPHFVFTWKRCAHQDLECVIIRFRYDGDVFGAHDLSPTVSSLRRCGSNQFHLHNPITSGISGHSVS
jgi:hypothetical protein